MSNTNLTSAPLPCSIRPSFGDRGFRFFPVSSPRATRHSQSTINTEYRYKKMRPLSSNWRWFAVAVCLAATCRAATAEEGVVQISDADKRPGVVRLGDQPDQSTPQQKSVRLTVSNVFGPSVYGYGHGYSHGYPVNAGFNAGACGAAEVCGHGLYCPQYCGAAGFPGPVCVQGPYCSPCADNACGDDSNCCNEGCNAVCSCGSACPGACCPCGCQGYSYGAGRNHRLTRVFATAAPKGSCRNGEYPKRWWRGQQENYFARNQRLSNILFGWLVPSGCGGQGCPPVGCYQITYADQPGYQNPQDGMAYGAQGYGVPVTVPLPPNVRQSYNYSSGIPSSRITQIGQYDPSVACPQPLYRQSW